ncbi:NAD(P)-binding protein, partial [Lepidopterella palustris CBS 459.81]
MVPYKEIQSNNTSLPQSTSNLTAVFVGGTNGIGLGALRALTKHTDSPTIYIVGRSQSSLEKLISELKTLNKTGTFIPVHAADLTLVKDASQAANQIAKDAKKIDLLIMSPGYISAGREESSEELDKVTAIRFYSRMRFLVTLAPLLRASSSPRVITVLASGQEGQLWPDDFRLKDHYSLINAGGASSSMTTLFLEEFAKKPGNEKMSFVHIYPGMVGGTGLKITGLGPWLQRLVDWVVVPLMKLFGYTIEEAGERVLFAATSEKFRRVESGEGVGIQGQGVAKGSDGEAGSGVYLVQGDSSVITGGKALKKLREEGVGEKLYQHTMEELERIEK